MLKLVVLISGEGSNLQAMIDSIQAGQLNARILLVISNRADAKGLARAAAAGLPTEVLDHHHYAERQRYDEVLQQLIDKAQPDIVVLAGFMRILSAGFVRHFRNRLLNIHPSLLPRHKGLHTHTRALADGDHEHGCSVHVVNEELDGGAVLAQASLLINTEDDAESLADRVHHMEHQLYPTVLQALATGHLHIQEDCHAETLHY
ncbi:MAG: phosphoribosylglycinamide formyltransferase, partial [Pseudomonadales bacterium]|nr:phosphoribosylglycinamide formyltransferase [Pseudomonadales bacterium]